MTQKKNKVIILNNQCLTIIAIFNNGVIIYFVKVFFYKLLTVPFARPF